MVTKDEWNRSDASQQWFFGTLHQLLSWKEESRVSCMPDDYVIDHKEHSDLPSVYADVTLTESGHDERQIPAENFTVH